VAIAGGLANVKAILSTKTPGPDTGGGTGPGPSQPNIPSFDPTAGLAETAEGQDTGNVVGPGGQGGSGVIKAYVVAEEMTSQQEANQKIEDLARL
jgi:hypothetical protein